MKPASGKIFSLLILVIGLAAAVGSDNVTVNFEFETKTYG